MPLYYSYLPYNEMTHFEIGLYFFCKDGGGWFLRQGTRLHGVTYHVPCSQSCCITCVADVALYSNLNCEVWNKVLLNEVALCFYFLHRSQIAVECVPRLDARVVCLRVWGGAHRVAVCHHLTASTASCGHIEGASPAFSLTLIILD